MVNFQFVRSRVGFILYICINKLNDGCCIHGT